MKNNDEKKILLNRGGITILKLGVGEELKIDGKSYHGSAAFTSRVEVKVVRLLIQLRNEKNIECRLTSLMFFPLASILAPPMRKASPFLH